jgi:two-component system, NarL family, response regulator NreC
VTTATDLHEPAAAPAATGPPAAEPIGVVLAENHKTMRRSLRVLLDGETDLEVIAEAVDLKTALDVVRERQPPVLVLDLRVSIGSGMDAIRRLHEAAPITEIVALSMHENPAYAVSALTAGAIGYVLKDDADSDLPEAVRRAATHGEYISPRARPRSWRV